MGGLRHINGYPGEAPPRMHLSIGDSLAGMFAAQGILAAIYWRDVAGSGLGQVVDVSLMEASFAMLESTVPEYDRLGIVRGPQGTNLKGIAPSNIFKSRDDVWMVIAANADNVFRRLCEAMDRPELADDERFSTHLARGDNQDEIEGIVADWAGEHDATEIDRILNEAGVICGPIYTDRGHLRGSAVPRARHAARARRPGVRAVHRARGRPEAHANSGGRAVVGSLGDGEPQRRDLRRAPRPRRGRACVAARGGRDLSATVMICDVGPRDGLQNDAVTLEPPVRADLVDRLAAAGLPRIEAVSFVHPGRVPQMAGAEEVVAAIHPEEGVTYAGLVLNERGYDRFATTALTEAHYAFAVSEEFNQRNAGASTEESVVAGEQVVERAKADGVRATVTLGTSFGCPFEGAIDPGRVLELAGRFVHGGADEIVFADTVGVGVPRQVRHLVAEGVKLGVTVGVHLHNTRSTGYANALVALEAGATVLDASVGGIGGCPFAPRATGNIATEDLVYLLHGEGIETGIDLDRLIEVAAWLEGRLGRPLEGQVYKAGAFAPVMAL